MATHEPLVRFYDLSGPQPWSPACWNTRYALNFKGIPYTTVKVPFPEIKPTCEKLLGDLTGLDDTVPIIEVLGADYKALNDSTPIAELLEERFPAQKGFSALKGLDQIKQYEEKMGPLRMWIVRWIATDIYENALDPNDGSKEFFKATREGWTGCALKDITEVRGGGETAVLQEIRNKWSALRDRMKEDDGAGEPTYLDFWDAGNVMWILRSSPEKYEKLKGLYGDDTFVKLMMKVEKYSA